MRKGDWIFIGDNNRADLMCQVYQIKDELISFIVENGAWEGTFDINQQCVRVHKTREVMPAKIVYSIQNIPKGNYNEVLDIINERLRSCSPCLREDTHRPTLENSSNDIRPPAFRSDTRDEKVRKIGKLRRLLLSPTKYLVVDIEHKEVRLFERQDKRNVLIRSMAL